MSQCVQGFFPGGGSLHSMMTSHGPDAKCFEAVLFMPCPTSYSGDPRSLRRPCPVADGWQESTKELVPERVAKGTMAFMFESVMSMKTTAWAQHGCGKLQADYYMAWQGLKSHFNPSAAPPGTAPAAAAPAPAEVAATASAETGGEKRKAGHAEGRATRPRGK